MPGPDPRSRIEKNLRILEQMPDNHLARFGLANAFLDAGDPAAAAPHYRRCLESQPDWMAAAIGLGRCLVMTGDKAGALEALSSARRLAIQQGHSSPLEEIAELEARCR